MEGNNNQQGLYNVQQELEEGSSFDFKIIYTTLILNWQWFVLSLIICLRDRKSTRLNSSHP